MEELILNNNQCTREHTLNTIIVKDKFWSVVNDMRWYEISETYKNNAVDLMENYLLENFSVDEITELQRFEVMYRSEMEDFIKSYVENSHSNKQEYILNDDETFYLASHIVGMGRTMYLYVKDNPDIIYNLQNNYTPCFEDGFDKAIYAMNFAE